MLVAPARGGESVFSNDAATVLPGGLRVGAPVTARRQQTNKQTNEQTPPPTASREFHDHGDKDKKG
jgi:hypothetical protein